MPRETISEKGLTHDFPFCPSLFDKRFWDGPGENLFLKKVIPGYLQQNKTIL